MYRVFHKKELFVFFYFSKSCGCFREYERLLSDVEECSSDSQAPNRQKNNSSDSSDKSTGKGYRLKERKKKFDTLSCRSSDSEDGGNRNSNEDESEFES